MLGQTKHKIDLGQIRIDAPLASPHTALSDVRVPLKLLLDMAASGKKFFG